MSIPLPEELPMMTLANTVLLPQTIMPLYIFEKRYRRMLADALAGSRIFAVAKKQSAPPSGLEPLDLPCLVATAGLVRLSTLNADGTSTVILQGSMRIRIDSIVRETPYRVVRAHPLPSIPLPSASAANGQKRRLLKLIAALGKSGGPQYDLFYRACRDLDDLEAIGHLAIQTCCGQTEHQQAFLETLDVGERMDAVAKLLSSELDARRSNALGELGELPEGPDPSNN